VFSLHLAVILTFVVNLCPGGGRYGVSLQSVFSSPIPYFQPILIPIFQLTHQVLFTQISNSSWLRCTSSLFWSISIDVNNVFCLGFLNGVVPLSCVNPMNSVVQQGTVRFPDVCPLDLFVPLFGCKDVLYGLEMWVMDFGWYICCGACMNWFWLDFKPSLQDLVASLCYTGKTLSVSSRQICCWLLLVEQFGIVCICFLLLLFSGLLLGSLLFFSCNYCCFE